jgi:hypothetical protein
MTILSRICGAASFQQGPKPTIRKQGQDRHNFARDGAKKGK